MVEMLLFYIVLEFIGLQVFKLLWWETIIFWISIFSYVELNNEKYKKWVKNDK
jgi:hypothetical protein